MSFLRPLLPLCSLWVCYFIFHDSLGTEYFTTMKFDPLVNKLDLYNVGTYENEEYGPLQTCHT